MRDAAPRLSFVLVGTASIQLLMAVSLFWIASALGEVADVPAVLLLVGLLFPFFLLCGAAAAFLTAVVLALADGVLACARASRRLAWRHGLRSAA